MPMAEAMRRCPHAIVVRHRMDRYAEASRALLRDPRRLLARGRGPLARRGVPRRAPASERLLGDGPTIGRAIKQRVRDELSLVASVGVAPIKLAAKIASDIDKPDGLRVVTPEDQLLRVPARAAGDAAVGRRARRRARCSRAWACRRSATSRAIPKRAGRPARRQPPAITSRRSRAARITRPVIPEDEPGLGRPPGDVRRRPRRQGRARRDPARPGRPRRGAAARGRAARARRRADHQVRRLSPDHAAHDARCARPATAACSRAPRSSCCRRSPIEPRKGMRVRLCGMSADQPRVARCAAPARLRRGRRARRASGSAIPSTRSRRSSAKARSSGAILVERDDDSTDAESSAAFSGSQAARLACHRGEMLSDPDPAGRRSPARAYADDGVATYALVVGSNAGGPGQGELHYAEDDAAPRRRAAHRARRLRGRPGRRRSFTRRRTSCAIGSEARRQASPRTQAAGRQSRVLFYYSGPRARDGARSRRRGAAARRAAHAAVRAARRRSPSSCSTPVRAARSRASKAPSPPPTSRSTRASSLDATRRRRARVVVGQRAVAGERAAAARRTSRTTCSSACAAPATRTTTARSSSTRPIATPITRRCSRPRRPRSAASTSRSRSISRATAKCRCRSRAPRPRTSSCPPRSRARRSSRTSARTPSSPRPTRRRAPRFASRSRRANIDVLVRRGTTLSRCEVTQRRHASISTTARAKRSTSTTTKGGEQRVFEHPTRIEVALLAGAERHDAYTDTLEAFGYDEKASCRSPAASRSRAAPMAPARVGRRPRVAETDAGVDARRPTGCYPQRFELRRRCTRARRRARRSRELGGIAALQRTCSSTLGLGIGRTLHRDQSDMETRDTYFGPAARGRRSASASARPPRSASTLGYRWTTRRVIDNLVGDTHASGGHRFGLGLSWSF